VGGEQTKIITFGDGDVEPSHGSQGGGDGTLNSIQLRYPGETEWRTPRTKDIVHDVPAGTVYLQFSGGGGGWGDPRERPAEKVRYDVRNGFLSPARAREDYGVDIDGDATGGQQ
jgi:N-methylhydantoinase B